MFAQTSSVDVPSIAIQQTPTSCEVPKSEASTGYPFAQYWFVVQGTPLNCSWLFNVKVVSTQLERDDDVSSKHPERSLPQRSLSTKPLLSDEFESMSKPSNEVHDSSLGVYEQTILWIAFAQSGERSKLLTKLSNGCEIGLPGTKQYI